MGKKTKGKRGQVKGRNGEEEMGDGYFSSLSEPISGNC